MPAVRVLLQARVGSARLPGKVLLPLGGLPLAVLCARRAGNTGRQVVMAIPDGSEDDGLAAAAASHGVPIRRGALDDVMSRFAAAIEDLDDDAVIVRLTGDNPLPDGAFVDFAVDTFLKLDVDYVGPEFGDGHLPHGLSAEVFRAGTLRSLERSATTAHEREHVTPGLRSRVPDRLPVAALGLAPAAGRIYCSVDRGSEYVLFRNVFESVADPIAVPWQTLLNRLVDPSLASAFRVRSRMVLGEPAGEMSLGTVQLGMTYGIANSSGRPDGATAADMVRVARMCGVTYFDTARMYGDSERVLGEAMAASTADPSPVRIVTKLPALTSASVTGSIEDWVRSTVARSAHELRRTALDVLLLHRWQDRHHGSGAVWRTLSALRGEGAIGALGASVQSVDEALAALDDPDVRHLQLPVNILDWRWRQDGFLRARAARPDVAVHGRSALLQGVLTMSPDRWPAVPGVSAAALSETLQRLVRTYDRSSMTDLAFAYVRSLDWIDTVVVGAERADQVIANVELFRRPALTHQQSREIAASLPLVPDTFLNPALWPTTTN
jgi:spore coat polysaccharide biosynthesis protein SpsF (cytidylyltransferase family)/aryl-alcohol dehydrogenase-like predicted oxidoreductase